MNVSEVRLRLLKALYDSQGAQTTTELCRLVDADALGWPEDDIKHALDGLADAGLVRWEARGEHSWALTPAGQNYLAASS